MTKPSASSSRSWRRAATKLSALIVVPYVLVAGMFIGLQRSLIYPAMTSGPLLAADYAFADADFEDVTTTTSDGLTLHGWHVRPARHSDSEPRPVVLFLHGNGGNRVHRLDDLELLVEAGAEVVQFDYRGYGENAGEPSEAALALDARAMWGFVTRELEIPHERIVLFGESLGGGVAVELAAAKCEAGTPPAGLILRSTFSSMTDAASHHYPWLPVRLALLDRYESLDKIGRISCPILSLHGDTDDIVPIGLGRRLFDAAPRRSASGVEKRFVVLAGAGHNDVIDVARTGYRAAVEMFLDEIPSDTRSSGKPDG